MHRSGALSSRIKRHGGAAYLGGDTGGVAALYGQSIVTVVLDDCGEGNSAVGICGECAALVPRCAALGDFGEVGLVISVDIWRGSGIQHQIGERFHCGAHIVGIGCRDGQHLVEEGVVALGQRNIIELLCVCLAQLVIGVYNTLDIGIVFDALYRGQASDRIDDGLLQTKDLLPLLGGCIPHRGREYRMHG